MAQLNEELETWFDELEKIPDEYHLLCPKIQEDDDEDYHDPDNTESGISVEEKRERIRKGNERIEITYWNSITFGFRKNEVTKWAERFAPRLEKCLQGCPDCVLNWHMKRKAYLQKFAERWDEDAVSTIRDMLDHLDVNRIGESLKWAEERIAQIVASGKVFKKALLGDRITEVHIAVYEALCCVEYMRQPEQRRVFQHIFTQIKGKGRLKLGVKVPLPGLVHFLFDYRNDERRGWAHENWGTIDKGSMTEEQFDWAVRGALVSALEDMSMRDLAQPTSETDLQIEQFWQAFEVILKTMTDVLVQSGLRSLELNSGVLGPFDLLFRHIQFCKSEDVQFVAIRVLTSFLKISPKALWEVVGAARPNAITDMLFSSPGFKSILRQSLEDRWASYDSRSNRVSFATSWIEPWMQSLSRDRRYDACEVLMHSLFETVAKDSELGEPGQAACARAGFDALTSTINVFLDAQEKLVVGSTHLDANLTFNLVMKHKSMILENLGPASDARPGHSSFKVAHAAKQVVKTAMKLDMMLFSREYRALCNNQELQSTVTRDSKIFWDGVVEVFDQSTEEVSFSEDILLALQPFIGVEPIRPIKKANQLNESSKMFNQALDNTMDALTRILGRVSELDETDLNRLFDNRFCFNVTVGLALQGESDFAEASSALLKTWTGELSRSAAFEQMSQLHPDRSLSSLIWCMDRILQPPFPWSPIRPLLNMSRDVLRGLADPSSGVLRVKTLNPMSASIVLRWWNEQWRFVSKACLNIEAWSMFISNTIMTEFCREIMELAEALIAEDSLIVSATCKSQGKSEQEMMVRILEPAKDNFRGMENMIRLKDIWLVDVTVRVLRKILSRLRENNLEINPRSRKLIEDACMPTTVPGRYVRSTNLSDHQRAELLEALGQNEDVQITKIGVTSVEQQPNLLSTAKQRDKQKKQSKLDTWSKSGTTSDSSVSTKTPSSRSNRDDVLDLSRSLDNPLLKQLEARQAKAKFKSTDHRAISALKESRQREKAEKAKRDAEAIARAKLLRGETVPGEGSGILGLGVPGKDHTRSEIMVNSSDEDSDSNDDDSDSDGQLAALASGGQKTMDEAEKRRQQALRDKLRRQPVKKIRQQRSVKEMRARLIPPMDRLHNIILAWDLFHRGNEPPSGPAATAVATKYPDPKSYQETFLPLLASEAWRSFVTAKDEITAQPFGMKIASRANVDSYLEIAFTMPTMQNRERVVSEGDILLVSEAEVPLSDSTAKHCLARVYRITYKKDLVEVTFRVAARNNPLAVGLSPTVTVYGVKITNMATIEREYAALESLQYYDLMDEVLKAEPSPILRYGEEKVTSWMKNWSLNHAQALAVLGAQDNDGFTLIQGPPGTGKTKTIVAMVGALLSDQLSQPAVGANGRLSRPPGVSTGPSQTRSKKLLVCAPSNAAVDELVLRLKSGITSIGGRNHKINVLRLGRSEAINAAVKDVTLDEQVRLRLEGDQTKDKAKADRDKLHEDASKLKEELSKLRTQLEESRGTENRTLHDALSRQFDELKRQQINIGKQIDANKGSGNSIAREMELRRRQIQQEILNSAHVLCATLSGSGHEMFRNLDVEFETVIIDEAAQCVELSALIPLKYGCFKCILVGDPKQLPPTVLSQSAAKFGYDQSLFVRMQQNHPKSVHLLDMQYRMHPEISLFPSKEFYERQLQDGQDMLQLRSKPWHKSALLGPYRFFDVEGVQERGNRGQSLVNIRELEVAMQIYDRFRKEYKDYDLRRKIGIITPYKAQLFELRARFRSRFGEDITDMIEFNTTDAFQGRECEIIIFSCVRASSTGGIGFMTDIRRMNVGLTRAKSSLWILGDSRALVQGEFWRKLIEDAKARDRYTHGDILGKFRRPLEQVQGFVYEPSTTGADEDIVMQDAAYDNTSPAVIPFSNAQQTPKPSVVKDFKETNPQATSVPRHSGPPPPNKPMVADHRKRSLDGTGLGQPAPKRVAGDKPRASLMGKFGQKPTVRQPVEPKDPSAMEVLGLAPPERPPSVANHANNSKTGSLSSSNGPKVPATSADRQGAPKPPNANQPVPRKKAKPSLFMPKKR